MSIVIKIESTETRTASGTSARTNREYSIRKQRGLLFRPGEQYPDKIEVVVPEGQAPYAPGDYVLHPSSFGVDRFGAVSLRVVLMPAQPAQLSKAS